MIDLKEIMSWVLPAVGLLSTLIIVVLNTRKLTSEIRSQEQKRQKQAEEGEKERTDEAVIEALKEREINEAISKMKIDINFAHNEVRSLKEKTNDMASDISQIKNGLNALRDSFEEIKAFLREDISKIHERVDNHLQSHNKMEKGNS